MHTYYVETENEETGVITRWVVLCKSDHFRSVELALGDRAVVHITECTQEKSDLPDVKVFQMTTRETPYDYDFT